jgi:hypothetical protein
VFWGEEEHWAVLVIGTETEPTQEALELPWAESVLPYVSIQMPK